MSETKYTVLRDVKGKHFTCGNDRCENASILEFHGFCERCWLKLTPTDRAILKGEEPPVVEVRHVTVRDIPPKPSRVWAVLDLLWRAGVTAAVAWLAWRK